MPVTDQRQIVLVRCYLPLGLKIMPHQDEVLAQTQLFDNYLLPSGKLFSKVEGMLNKF